MTRTVGTSNFFASSSALTAASLYGTDFTNVSSAGFVYASALTVRILAPAGNLTGACYTGSLTLSELAGCSSSSLIANATSIHNNPGEIILKSSIIQPGLIDQLDVVWPGSSTGIPTGFGGEQVAYVVY